ncbi:hypothetical protein [Methanolacinia petrolearia]|nr:hypothetical protein [Methanolacinia petrolearia]
MIVSAKTKYYMLRVWLCGNFSFNLLNEEPLTFVFSKNDENGLRFSGYEYNHYQSLRAKLRKMGIESNIVEFYEIYDDEKIKQLPKEERRKLKKINLV